jgi:hypothetical protein
MSAKNEIQLHVFGGEHNPLKNIIVQDDDATSPDGVVTAPKGYFLYVQYPDDDSDGDVYLNTDGSTAWTQIRNPV